MITIKFRAWDKRKKRMIPLEEKEYVLVIATGELLENGEGEFYPTEKNVILMQYTGLEDKNGKEIYEGDILRGYNRKIYQVLFPQIGGGFYIDWYDKKKKEGSRQIIGDYYEAVVYIGLSNSVTSNGKPLRDVRAEKYTPEIIGNIYENPELLEEIE